MEYIPKFISVQPSGSHQLYARICMMHGSQMGLQMRTWQQLYTPRIPARSQRICTVSGYSGAGHGPLAGPRSFPPAFDPQALQTTRQDRSCETAQVSYGQTASALRERQTTVDCHGPIPSQPSGRA